MKRLYNKLLKKVNQVTLDEINDHFSGISTGQLMEIYELSGMDNGYYKLLHCYVASEKPKQVVELGAAAGISTIMMATGNERTNIISVDCDLTAWKWMNREYPNVTKILGDDLDLSIYPEDLDLSKTDMWFIDTLHTKKQLHSEFMLYKKFFKPGTVIFVDDIHINPGMEEVWNELNYEKLDISKRMHYSGFGMIKI